MRGGADSPVYVKDGVLTECTAVMGIADSGSESIKDGNETLTHYWIKFTNGLIIQWGQKIVDTEYSGEYMSEITLPLSYSNNSFLVLVTRCSGVANSATSGAAISYNTIRISCSENEVKLNWFTIGY